MPDQFVTDLADRLQCLRNERSRPVAGWCIALSGGMDSQALLHAMVKLNSPEPLRAIHIHHGLSVNGDAWLLHCQTWCEALGIPFVYQRVDVKGIGKGIEDAARIARYQVFERNLGENEVLLQGHHLDDQCETLVLRMLRGSGSAGLSGMPESRSIGSGSLYRPLLSTSRQQIKAYAEDQQLAWVEDESNASDLYDRNYVRHSVLPEVEKRWPQYRKPLQQVTAVAQEERGLLSDLADLDLAKLTLTDLTLGRSWGRGLKGMQQTVGHSAQAQALSIAGLSGLSKARLQNVLRRWFALQGIAQPRMHQWPEVLKLLQARQDAQPSVSWPGAELRRFKGGLYLLRPQIAVPEFKCLLKAVDEVMPLPLGALSCSGFNQQPDDVVVLRLKQAGDEFRPKGRPRKSLKKYLQDIDMPPWIRPYVPVIELNGRLVWVAGLGLAEGFEITGDCPFSWRDF